MLRLPQHTHEHNTNTSVYMPCIILCACSCTKNETPQILCINTLTWSSLNIDRSNRPSMQHRRTCIHENSTHTTISRHTCASHTHISQTHSAHAESPARPICRLNETLTASTTDFISPIISPQPKHIFTDVVQQVSCHD